MNAKLGSSITAVDYFIMWLASSLAVMSAGMGLHIPAIGYLFVGIISAGCLFSATVNRLLGKSIVVKFDALFFFISAAVVLIFAETLNAYLPDGGFPRPLMLASILCYLLSFWSFSMWRDSTLLFPSVPAVALFSLVGSWDSFSGSTFAFFGFLMCFATLFARSQRRFMVQLAQDSGYREVEQLRRGPWKWMAGPEWALASAFVVILFSLLGAPVIQRSMQGVAGLVKVPTPPPAPRNPIIQAGMTNSLQTDVNVGQGPRELSDTPIFTARMDEARYLRTKTFDIYTGRGWQGVKPFTTRRERLEAYVSKTSLMNIGRELIQNGSIVPFTIQFLLPVTDTLPIPGEMSYLDNRGNFGVRSDGTILMFSANQSLDPMNGNLLVANTTDKPKNAHRQDLPEQYFAKSDSMRVRQLVAEVTADKATDYEKAIALKNEIEKRCSYNLNAQPISRTEDAVEQFLFSSHEGYCDLFATSMTVLARTAGLPARYCQGYLPSDTDRDEQDRFVLRESSYHAWCEILFDGKGWVVFDATEGAREVAGGERGRATKSDPFYKSKWFMIGAGSLLTLAVAFYLISSGLRAWSLRVPKTPAYEVGQVYEKFSRRLEKLTGKPRWPSQTPEEYIQFTADKLGANGAEAQRITMLFVGALYSPNKPTKQTVLDLRREVAEFARGRNAPK